MKLALALLSPWAAAVVVLGQFSPTAATSRGAMIERAAGAHPLFGLPPPSAPRRRAQEEQGALPLSQECMGDWLAPDETFMELLLGSDCQFNMYTGETGEIVGLLRCSNMSD